MANREIERQPLAEDRRDREGGGGLSGELQRDPVTDVPAVVVELAPRKRDGLFTERCEVPVLVPEVDESVGKPWVQRSDRTGSSPTNRGRLSGRALRPRYGGETVADSGHGIDVRDRQQFVGERYGKAADPEGTRPNDEVSLEPAADCTSKRTLQRRIQDEGKTRDCRPERKGECRGRGSARVTGCIANRQAVRRPEDPLDRSDQQPRDRAVRRSDKQRSAEEQPDPDPGLWQARHRCAASNNKST